MARPKITLYYDVVSPFGYMAYYMTRHAAVFQQCDITYIPIFLGGVMKACDNRPPLAIKNKDKWIELDRLRWAKAFNIPISKQVPDGFPVLTLTVQRALTAITTAYPDKLATVTDALFQAFWLERNESKVDKPEGLAKCLGSVLKKAEVEDVMSKIGTDEVKKLLNRRGEEAFNEGCFGIPFFLATNTRGQKEAFWGFDHIGQILQHLGLERMEPLEGGAGSGGQAML